MKPVTPLSGEEVEALREIKGACRGRPLVLVGARALLCWLRLSGRVTRDLDLTVACELEELPALLRRAGWTPDGREEQRWRTPRGLGIDILPAGPRVLADSTLTWPRSGHVMSVAGLDLALRHAEELEIAPELRFPVAPLAAIVFLKMTSYLDRPLDRERDLLDLACAVRDGIPLGERTTRETAAAGVDVFLAGAWLLGERLSTMVSTQDARGADAFLGKLLDEQDRDRSMARMAGASRFDSDELERLWVAFRDGFARRR